MLTHFITLPSNCQGKSFFLTKIIIGCSFVLRYRGLRGYGSIGQDSRVRSIHDINFEGYAKTMTGKHCFYCRRGDHRKCRRIKLDLKMCECECEYAKDFRQDAELYQELDGSDVVLVYRRLFPWRRLRTI